MWLGNMCIKWNLDLENVCESSADLGVFPVYRSVFYTKASAYTQIPKWHVCSARVSFVFQENLTGKILSKFENQYIFPRSFQKWICYWFHVLYQIAKLILFDRLACQWGILAKLTTKNFKQDLLPYMCKRQSCRKRRKDSRRHQQLWLGRAEVRS